MASVNACMTCYFFSLFRIDTADLAQPKVLDGHHADSFPRERVESGHETSVVCKVGYVCIL